MTRAVRGNGDSATSSGFEGRPDCASDRLRTDTGPMGMNPFRPHRRSPADFVMVGAALVVVIGLVVWAIRG